MHKFVALGWYRMVYTLLKLSYYCYSPTPLPSQMEAIVGEGTPPIVLLSPQRIILDRTNCVDPPYYHNPGM